MDGETHEEQAGGLMLFEQAVEHARVAICFSDARKPDNPLTYVNPAFEAMTGYARDDVLGRNCRFLQGPGTDPETVARLRDAIRADAPITVEILNYRRDGSPFWNALHVAPILGPDGEVVQYYGSQLDVSDAVAARLEEADTGLLARELRHRAANLFSIFGALVSLSLPKGASDDAVRLADAISARAQALGRAHMLSARRGAGGADLAELADAVLSPFADGARLAVAGPRVRLPDPVAGPFALILHELTTNAVVHGALREGANGALNLTWAQSGEDLVLRWTERAEAPFAPGAATAGTGTQITDGIVASLGGRLDRVWEEEGLRAVLTLPLGNA